MKFTFTNLLGETVEILSEQPAEVSQAIKDTQKCTLDQDIRAVMEYLNNQETKYVTYSHS